MPLLKSKSKKAMGENIKTEMENGMPQKQAIAVAYNMKRHAGKKMAMGGMMTNDGYQSSCSAGCNSPCEIHEQASGFVEHESDVKRPNEMAMSESDRDLNQHGEDEMGPDGARMAMGGDMEDYQKESPDMRDDLVARVMKQRMYSKGGMVANDTPITAGFESNDFDDLARRDELESSYTGANSGDEDGSDDEDMRRKDVVMRAMLAHKKGKMPRPA